MWLYLMPGGSARIITTITVTITMPSTDGKAAMVHSAEVALRSAPPPNYVFNMLQVQTHVRAHSCVLQYNDTSTNRIPHPHTVHHPKPTSARQPPAPRR